MIDPPKAIRRQVNEFPIRPPLPPLAAACDQMAATSAYCLPGVAPVLQRTKERVDQLYAQSFWWSIKGYNCHMAAIALAKRSLNVTTMFLYWGPGGVGLSLTTAHLAAMMGGQQPPPV